MPKKCTLIGFSVSIKCFALHEQRFNIRLHGQRVRLRYVIGLNCLYAVHVCASKNCTNFQLSLESSALKNGLLGQWFNDLFCLMEESIPSIALNSYDPDVYLEKHCLPTKFWIISHVAVK